jgi:hypothetical protein
MIILSASVIATSSEVSEKLFFLLVRLRRVHLKRRGKEPLLFPPLRQRRTGLKKRGGFFKFI